MKKVPPTSGLNTSRKVKIVNLGCSKNLVDSENILGEFGRAGFTLAGPEDAPTVTVINTCGFIEAAKEESIQEIFETIRGRQVGEKIVVAGCLSQRYMQELETEIPEADLWIGTYQPGEILERLGLTSTLPSDCQYGASPRVLMGEEPHHAHLKIAEGCNRICGFCAIPGMRGKQRSRSIVDIVAEAQQLESWGIKEVSLIAQDLTYFGREKGGTESLEELLRTLLRETGIPWFRLMYAYPAFLTDGLIDVMATNTRICKYLDMPIQHFSDTILQSMRRNYTQKEVRSQLTRLRTAMPDIALRTTMLLGYPGETERDVQEVLEAMDEIRFRHLGAFSYSDEDGTWAKDLPNKIPTEEAEERLGRVMDFQREISTEHLQSRIGTEVTVILDSVAEGEAYHYVGRTEGDAPEVDGQVLIHGAKDAEIGSIRQVLITEAHEYDLEGVLQD